MLQNIHLVNDQAFTATFLGKRVFMLYLEKSKKYIILPCHAERDSASILKSYDTNKDGS